MPAPPSTSAPAMPRGIWSGTALQVVGRIWSASCTLAIFFVLSRHLSEPAFGRFTFYLAVFAWLDSFATLGTGQVAVQRTATDPDSIHAVLASARRIRILAGLLGVLLVGGWAFARGEHGAVWILIASFYPVTHALELPAVVFRNRISWRIPVLMRSLASAMGLGFVGLLLATGTAEPALYLLGIALGSTLANVLLYRASRPLLPPVTGPITPAPGVFAAALPLGLSALCAQMYFYIDNLFVSVIAGEGPLGHYNVAVRFLSILIMIAQYVSLAALPWFSRCNADGTLGAALGRLAPASFAAACAVAGLLWPWTYELLELFRPGNGVASWSLRWLLLATTAIYAGSMLLTGVVATKDNRAVLAVTAVALAVNVGANFWAVPRYGITGAGATTFVTEATVALGSAIALARGGVRMRGASPARWLAGPLLFAAALGFSTLVHGG